MTTQDLLQQAKQMMAHPERFTEDQARALVAKLDKEADYWSDEQDDLRGQLEEAEEKEEACSLAYDKLAELINEEGGPEWGTQAPTPEVPGQLALLPVVPDVPPKGVA